MPKIEVNHGAKHLEAPGSQSLLDALKGHGIYLPSACGGRGVCGLCKVKVLTDLGPPLAAEQHLLRPADMEGGLRMGCQVRVDQDLGVELPTNLLTVRDYCGRVESIRNLTYDIREISIRLIEPEKIEFVPGQYVELEVPVGNGRPASVRRAYSIASTPEDPTRVELIIRLVPGGICTTWVFEELGVGQEVKLSGPMGEFRLSRTAREMVWISGGSGMSPFWSMVRHMKAAGIVRPTTFFFGAVGKEDLFLLDELRELSRELPWFRFIPSLSDPEVGQAWDGETGMITQAVDRNVGDGTGKEAYLCGSPGMVEAAIAVLEQKNFRPRTIFYDKYT